MYRRALAALVAETAPTVRVWPRPLVFALLLAYVVADGALWLVGFYYLFESQLEPAGLYLTLALVVLLVAGWAWRWWVAQGWIGGRPTMRFGGS